MKKFAALLIAGVMSVGIFSFAACNPDSEPSGGEVNDKIPQIPDGVSLNDVSDRNVEATFEEIAGSGRTGEATDIKVESYFYEMKSSYDNNVFQSGRVYEHSAKAKYLSSGNKSYGELITDSYVKENSEFSNEIPCHYLTERDVTSTVFLSDETIGLIQKFADVYEYEDERETGNIPEELISIYINGEEPIRQNYRYNGIDILNIFYQQGPTLPYAGYTIQFYNSYKQDGGGNCLYLYGGGDSDASINIISSGAQGKLNLFSFDAQANENIMYLDFQYSLEATYPDSNVKSTYEYRYVYYIDLNAGLKPGDFTTDYLTDDITSRIYYYDCDTAKVAEDFLAGKEVVINPVGGYDTSDISYGFDEYNYIYSAPYVLYTTEYAMSGYLAGVNSSANAARVENGKFIIEAGAYEAAVEDAKRFAAIFGYDDSDMENAKKYLVINWGIMPHGYLGSLYISLN